MPRELLELVVPDPRVPQARVDQHDREPLAGALEETRP
jgi:hypothetical protein